MALLLLLEDAGLGACFLGAFRHADRVLATVRAPQGAALFGAVLVGMPASDDRPSASLTRPGPSRESRVLRGSY
jgi:hypothetical protein